MDLRSLRPRSRATTAVVFVAAMVVVPTLAAAAPAKPAGGSKDVRQVGLERLPDRMEEILPAQRRLNQAADRIEEAAQPLGKSGFAGFIVSPETKRLRLYWHGDLPEQVQSAIQRLRAPNTRIEVRSAPYTRPQLVAAMKRIASSGAKKNAGLDSIEMRRDRSGLIVRVQDKRVARRSLSASAGAVAVTYAEPIYNAAPSYNRWNDIAPYWGGGAISSAHAACSTGFPMTRQSDGEGFMLFATHCVANSNERWWTSGSGQILGRVKLRDSTDNDLAAIKTSVGVGVYTGGVERFGGTETRHFVQGMATNRVGNWVCSSGAYSGERCAVEIKAVNQVIRVEGRDQTWTFSDMVRGEHVTQDSAGGNGDSGGPIYYPAWNGTDGLGALGILSAQDTDTEVPCTGAPSGPNRSCAWRVWWADIEVAKSQWGLVPRSLPLSP